MNYKVILVGLLWTVGVHAQAPSEIATRIEALRADTSISEEKRSAAIALLGEAQQVAQRATDRAEAVKGYVAAAAAAEATLEELAVELERVQQGPPIDVPDDVAVSFIDTQLSQLQAERATLDASLETLRAREADLLARASEIASEIATARAEAARLAETAPPQQSDADPVAQANRVKVEAQIAERQAAVADLAAERTTLAARQEIAAARLDLVNAQLARLTESIASLQKRLGESRIGRARTRLREVSAVAAQTAGLGDALQRLASDNVELARNYLDLVERGAVYASDTLQLQQDLARVTTSAQTVEQVLATGQLNDDTAQLLRDVRYRLPSSDQLAEAMTLNDQTMVGIRLNRVLWQDRLRNLSDLPSATDVLLTGYGESQPASELTTSAIGLVAQRRDLLHSLSTAARDNADQLSAQRLVRQDLRERTLALAGLLDRRLLWLPTRIESGQTLLRNLYSNIAWFFSPTNWYAVVKAVVGGYASFNSAAVGLGLAAIGLLLMAPLLRRRLVSLAEFIGNVRKDTYLSTPLALLISFLLALPLPLAVGSIGLAAGSGPGTGFTAAVAQGLIAAAAVLFVLSGFRVLARPDGVFQRHFGWRPQPCRQLRFHLSWFMAVEATVAFVFTAALASDDLVIKYGIGRLAFVISSVAIALFAFHYLKPRGGIAVSVSESTPAIPGLKILFFVLVTAPLAVGVMPLFGYYEAAIALQTRIFQSGIILLLAAIVYRLTLRFFLIGHRRLTLKRLTKLRQQEAQRRKFERAADQSGDAMPKLLDEEVADPDTLSAQSRRGVLVILFVVLALGLWSVWSGMLPALGIVNDVVLWQGTHYVGGQAITSGVSVWDLVTALFWIASGLVVARNARGILELTIFERFNVDPGTRYAVIAIAGYLLVGVGLVAGLSRLGVNWSSLQWIIAALGVGLGFRLQEIVANFVSGLIILFERPIRIGDIVTIGQLEGTVTSIKIRATRITDFDNREVLMPNKSIITENVTNWTLSDQVTRIILRVGVAYGSDIDRVRELIFDAVSRHPDTLSVPVPAVFFMAHGESSLDFEARVFVATPAKRLPVTHDLNRAINRTLAEHNIEIPFPQRDLHLRTNVAASEMT